MSDRATIRCWEPVSLLSYVSGLVEINLSTGKILWKPRPQSDPDASRWNTRHAGKEAGGTGSGDGYRRIQVIFDGRKYGVRCHRLIWFAAHGPGMPEMLDHMNGDRSDNRLFNLRPADKQLNAENQRTARSDNSLGVLGVSPHGNKFRAVIRSKGKRYHLGLFDSPEQAHAAYVDAKRRVHAGGTL